jgi:transcriptional regulator with XRE-family HTH domain
VTAKVTTAIDGEIGLRIKMRRLALKMSQERLGELVGVTFQQVQKYEKGTNRVTAARLLDVAKALGAPVTSFFGEERASISAPRGDIELFWSRQGAELAEAFARIANAKVRRAIIDFARAAAAAETITGAGRPARRAPARPRAPGRNAAPA